MKKICSFLALILFSAMSFAGTIGAPASIDFGTYSIKGKSYVKDSLELTLNPSGISDWGIGVEVVNDAESVFSASDSWLYANGTPDYYGVEKAKVYFTATKAGTFTAKLRLTDYQTEAYEDVALKVIITNEAIVVKTIPFERVNSLSELKNNDTIVFVSESAGAINGTYDGSTAHMDTLKTNVTIDAANGKAEIPETAQMFKATQYSGNWQFWTVAATSKRLNLDIVSNNAKGAFTFNDPVAGQILATWGVSISSGVAVISRPDDDQTYPIRFNGDRFKPYKSASTGTNIAIYKKKGSAQPLVSSVEIEPATINMESLEMEETGSITINYTAKNLTDDIVWSIEGTDYSWFDVSDTGNRESGTVTISYNGLGNRTGAVSASLAYLTVDIQGDMMEGYFPINLTLKANTIKLTKIEFVGVPDSLIKGKSIDLKPYLVYTPGNAEDKSLTWTVDKSYQGTVADGVYTAKEVTGNVTITATSVKVPSVSASVTIMQYEPKPASITLDKHEITTYIGNTEVLSATVGPDGASQDCYFTIRNTSILSYAKGDVTGSAKLTAKALCPEGVWVVVNPKNYQTILDSCLVKVIPVAVESVAFDPDTKEMTVGAQYQLTPVVTPSAAASQYTASYVSNKTSVATVSETGLVTAVAEGTAEITCTLGGKSGKITISVVDAPLFTKVTDISSLKAKDTIILALQSAPVIAGAIDGKKLTALTSGITVTDAGAYADAAYKLVIGTIKNKTGFSLQPVGSTKVLAEQNNDLYLENTTSTKNLMWEFVADGTNGIFVRNLGNSDAMFKYHAGNAAIKPYKAGTVGAVYVYVYVRPYTEPVIPAAEGVSLDQTTLDFYVGDADVTLKATVTPSGADQAVIWESSNTAVATVSTSGKVHAVAKGTATITAKVKSNETLKAECAVTVNEKEDPTAIEAVGIKGRATKVIREGQVIIIREEKEYDVVGRQLK